MRGHVDCGLVRVRDSYVTAAFAWDIDVAASSTCATSCDSAESSDQRVVGTEMLIAATGRPW